MHYIGNHKPLYLSIYCSLYYISVSCIWLMLCCVFLWLTHWGQVTHICVVKLTIIGSDNGLWPGRRQAIIWTNAEILLNGPLGTNFIEILIGIQTFSFKKIHLKMSSGKWQTSCLGLNVLSASQVYPYASRPLPQSHDCLWGIWVKMQVN